MNFKKRKIFKSGNSKAISLPPEWVRGHENVKSVELCYDGDIIIAFPEGYSEIKKQVLLETLTS